MPVEEKVAAEETPEQVEEQVEETPDETQEEETTEETPDGSDKEEKSSYSKIISLLEDPKTRKAAIQFLASQEGMKFSEPDEEVEVETKKETVKSIEDEIKEIMGSDVDQIPAKTWNAIDRMIERRLAGIEDKLISNENRTIKDATARATTQFYKDFPDVAKFENDFIAEMKKFQPQENTDPYDFLVSVYYATKGRKSVNKVEDEKNKRIKRNSKDVQLTSVGSPFLTSGSKRMKLGEAIDSAFANKRLGG